MPMNFKWDKKYLHWGITAFAVIVAGTVFLVALLNYESVASAVGAVWNMLMPLVMGFVIAYVLSPIATFFEKSCFRKIAFFIDKKKKERLFKSNPAAVPEDNMLSIKKACRALSVVATMLFAVILFVGLFFAVIPQLFETVQTLINNMPNYISESNAWLTDLLEDYPDISAAVSEFFNNITTYIMDWLKTSILPQMTDIVGTLSSGIMSVISVFLNVILGFIISIYFLYHKELFAAQIKKVLYAFLKPKTTNAILRNMREINIKFGGFFTGKLIDSFIVGVLFFILMTIFNMPYAMLVSVLMGVFNIIPYFGPIIGAVPSALLILMENPLACLYFIIMVVVIQQLDGNVISPKILGDSTGLSSFWVIFAILLGQSIFGFVGLIIGIPLFAVIYSFCKAKITKRLEKKGLPSDSNVYRKVAFIDAETGEIQTMHELHEKQREEKRRAEEEAKLKKRQRFKNPFKKK